MRQEALLVLYSGQREPQARFARELATVGGGKSGDCRHLFFEFEDLACQAFAFGLARIQVGQRADLAEGHATAYSGHKSARRGWPSRPIAGRPRFPSPWYRPLFGLSGDAMQRVMRGAGGLGRASGEKAVTG